MDKSRFVFWSLLLVIMLAASSLAQQEIAAAEGREVRIAEQASVGETAIPALWYLAPGASLAALIVAFFFYKKMMADPEGNETMVTIAGHVREGANAYLLSQYKIVGLVFVLLFLTIL